MHYLDFMNNQEINDWAHRLDDVGAKQVIYELRHDALTDDQISDFFDAINFYPEPESWDA